MLVACHAVAPPPIAPASAKPPEPVAEPVKTGFAGRILVDGVPVPRFAVTVAAHYVDGRYGPQQEFHATDGRFAIATEPGTWDVVIAAPGLARRLLPERRVRADELNLVGDVAMEHGHVIQGQVTDERGRPVVGAVISVVEDPWPRAEADLAARTRGNLTSSTDADGRYRVEGYAPLAKRRAQISVHTSDRRVAPPSPVADADATIDFTVAHGGVLTVTVEGNPNHFLYVMPVPPRGAVLQGQHVDSDDVFEDLPAGAYDVILNVPGEATSQHQRVTIEAGAGTAITMTAPTPDPVAVTIHARRGSCVSVHLGAPRLPGVTASCIGSDAQFPVVPPGSYFACVQPHGPCASIRVQKQPAAQAFDL